MLLIVFIVLEVKKSPALWKVRRKKGKGDMKDLSRLVNLCHLHSHTLFIITKFSTLVNNSLLTIYDSSFLFRNFKNEKLLLKRQHS